MQERNAAELIEAPGMAENQKDVVLNTGVF